MGIIRSAEITINLWDLQKIIWTWREVMLGLIIGNHRKMKLKYYFNFHRKFLNRTWTNSKRGHNEGRQQTANKNLPLTSLKDGRYIKSKEVLSFVEEYMEISHHLSNTCIQQIENLLFSIYLVDERKYVYCLIVKFLRGERKIHS